MKELVHEKFVDGILSAIDYSMHMEKEENPAGVGMVIQSGTEKINIRQGYVDNHQHLLLTLINDEMLDAELL